MFDHEEYNNEAKMDPNEFDDQNNFLGNPFKNEIEIINEDNDFFGSSNKSVFNSSNFSFKCLINNTNESIQKKLKMNKFAKTYCKNIFGIKAIKMTTIMTLFIIFPAPFSLSVKLSGSIVYLTNSKVM